MKLLDKHGKATDTVISQTALDETDTVYNFAVQDFSTYHIGEFGVWVHNDCNTSGWISKKVWSSLSPSIQKKFQTVMSKGIVSPTANQGVIKLSPTEELVRQGCTHKLENIRTRW